MLIRSSAFLLAVSGLLAAQDIPAKRIDEIFTEWTKPGSPGVGVAVVQSGKVAFEKGYGLANLEYDIPVTPRTIFHVASVSKQFTAMALVLLEQDGKLSLEDDIHKYLPELPDYGAKITIRNLLQHTSGIRDQWQTLSLAGWRMDDVFTQKQILRMLFHQKELNFPPGTRHLYSNGGYTLAAEITARVSGKPFPEFCAERIFRPLGMTRTHFHLDHRLIVHDRAYSYEKSDEGFRASPLNYANVGATSLFTTAGDLVRWLDNLRDPKVGGRAGVERLQERAVLTGGARVDYALGVAIGRRGGLKTISHAGGDAGYRSYVVWFPEIDLGVAVVSNLASVDTGRLAVRAAAVFAGPKMQAETAAPERNGRRFIRLEPAALEQFTGDYHLDGELLVHVVKRGDRLMAAVGEELSELKPLSANRFFSEAEGAELEFNSKPSGVMGVSVAMPSGHMAGERVPPPTADDLAQYSGAYWSDELETQYTVKVKDGKLIADHSHHGEIGLTTLGKDHFAGASFFFSDVNFVRDGSGKVAGMTVGGGRVTAVNFVRR